MNLSLVLTAFLAATCSVANGRILGGRGLGSPVPNPVKCKGKVLHATETLEPNEGICNNGYEFGLDSDHKVYLWDAREKEEEKVLWVATDGDGKEVKGDYLHMTRNGNLVLYTGDKSNEHDAQWAINCAGNPGTKLKVSDEGSVKAVLEGEALWILRPNGKEKKMCN